MKKIGVTDKVGTRLDVVEPKKQVLALPNSNWEPTLSVIATFPARLRIQRIVCVPFSIFSAPPILHPIPHYSSLSPSNLNKKGYNILNLTCLLVGKSGGWFVLTTLFRVGVVCFP